MSTHLLPDTRNIAESATKVYGIRVEYRNGLKVLVSRNGQELQALSQKAGLTLFNHFIKDQLSLSNARVVLLADNGHKFDFPILLRSLARYNLLDTLTESNMLLTDSLEVIAQEMKQKDSLLNGLKSKSLSNIFYFLFHEEFSAHDAKEDVEALGRITTKLKFTKDQLYRCSSTISSMRKAMKSATNAKARKSTLHSVPASNGMKEKLARAGLDLATIKDIVNTQGSRGLLTILALPIHFDHIRDISAKARVTKNCKVLTSLVNFFMK